MQLDIIAILCLSILNVFPWIYLLFQRPDEKIKNQLEESDAALAQLIQVIMHKMDSLEEIGENFGPQGNEINIGVILAQVLSQKMGLNGQNDYRRDERGQFNGPQEIIETEIQTLD